MGYKYCLNNNEEQQTKTEKQKETKKELKNEIEEAIKILNEEIPDEDAFEESLKFLIEESKKGNVSALSFLGRFYLEARFVERNVVDGLYYLDKASKLGDLDSTLILAKVFLFYFVFHFFLLYFI